MDGRRLARFLKPYGIRPRTVRIGAATAKGYHREDLMDAWRRYLPYPAGPSQPSQPSQRPDSDSSHVTAVTDVTANTGMGDTPPVCVHRPEHEADDLWALGDAVWGEDPRSCLCCAAPVKGEELQPDDGGLCPTCRAGQPAPERGGHVLRHALDLGLELEAAS